MTHAIREPHRRWLTENQASRPTQPATPNTTKTNERGFASSSRPKTPPSRPTAPASPPSAGTSGLGSWNTTSTPGLTGEASPTAISPPTSAIPQPTSSRSRTTAVSTRTTRIRLKPRRLSRPTRLQPLLMDRNHRADRAREAHPTLGREATLVRRPRPIPPVLHLPRLRGQALQAFPGRTTHCQGWFTWLLRLLRSSVFSFKQFSVVKGRFQRRRCFGATEWGELHGSVLKIALRCLICARSYAWWDMQGMAYEGVIRRPER